MNSAATFPVRVPDKNRKLQSLNKANGVSSPACECKHEGSGYRTIDRSLNLKPYSNIFCNVTVAHEEDAVGFVET